jgi:hypothetical protein
VNHGPTGFFRGRGWAYTPGALTRTNAISAACALNPLFRLLSPFLRDSPPEVRQQPA